MKWKKYCFEINYETYNVDNENDSKPKALGAPCDPNC